MSREQHVSRRAALAGRLMAPTLNPTDLVTRLHRDVERSVLRARNGVIVARGGPQARYSAAISAAAVSGSILARTRLHA